MDYRHRGKMDATTEQRYIMILQKKCEGLAEKQITQQYGISGATQKLATSRLRKRYAAYSTIQLVGILFRKGLLK